MGKSGLPETRKPGSALAGGKRHRVPGKGENGWPSVRSATKAADVPAGTAARWADKARGQTDSAATGREATKRCTRCRGPVERQNGGSGADRVGLALRVEAGSCNTTPPWWQCVAARQLGPPGRALAQGVWRPSILNEPKRMAAADSRRSIRRGVWRRRRIGAWPRGLAAVGAGRRAAL